ncbi:MAG: YggS family pyridoxal phosphate-dependent enzyme, partial [Bacteroidales bacterium]|nr:YggS family pyridoxal phosphate-dependent enzyme [Bacteroidales bacterium]
MDIVENIRDLNKKIKEDVTLVAVSKTKPEEDIITAYNGGHRDFGENKVQELTRKYETLPKDITWHFIGHLQTNKVKYIAPFVSLIHAVDSKKLLQVINKEGVKNKRVIPCLVQLKIAQEESKFGLSEQELITLLDEIDIHQLSNVEIRGVMGMATNSDNEELVTNEFLMLKTIFNNIK